MSERTWTVEELLDKEDWEGGWDALFQWGFDPTQEPVTDGSQLLEERLVMAFNAWALFNLEHERLTNFVNAGLDLLAPEPEEVDLGD